jgi:hypothetical protein
MDVIATCLAVVHCSTNQPFERTLSTVGETGKLLVRRLPSHLAPTHRFLMPQKLQSEILIYNLACLILRPHGRNY